MAMCGGSLKFPVRIPKISVVRASSARSNILLPHTPISTPPATLIQKREPQDHLLLQSQKQLKAKEGKKMIEESPADHHHHQIYKAAQAKGLKEAMYVDDEALFVVGLSKHMVEKDLRKYFGGHSKVHIRRDPVTHCSCGYAVVNFDSMLDVYLFNDMKHKIRDCWVTAWMAAPAGSGYLGQKPLLREHENNDDKIDSSYKPLIPGHGTIYVGGFSNRIDDVDESTIFLYFSTYGHVDAVELPRLDRSSPDDPNANEGYDPCSCRWALVRFTNPNDADKVIAISRHYIDNVHVIVHPTDGRLLHEAIGYREDSCIIEKRLTKAMAEETTIFLVGLANDIVEKDISDYLGIYGVFGLVHVRRDPVTNLSCGYAMVECCGFSAARLSPFINRKHVIKDCIVTAVLSAPPDLKHPCPAPCISYAAKQRKYKSYSLSSPAKLLHTGRGTIYVGGFSALCELVDESTIFQYFSQYGTVAAVELPRPDIDSHVSCKWALVRFIEHDDADAVVKVCSHYIGGVPVTVHLTDGRLLQELTEDRGIATKCISNSLVASKLQGLTQDRGIATKRISNALVASKGLPAGMVVCKDTIFLVGLAGFIEERDISCYFAEYGVAWVRIMRDPVTGHSYGYAFVRVHPFYACSLINREHIIKDCTVTAVSAAPRELRVLDAQRIYYWSKKVIKKCEDYSLFSPFRILPGRGTIYVGGFSTPSQVDAYIIADYFSKYGHVEACDLPYCKAASSKDPKRITNNPKSICNWALVRFSHNIVADQVIKASPHYIDGIPLTVHLTDGRLLPWEGDIVDSNKVRRRDGPHTA